jgi:hypothetical protein
VSPTNNPPVITIVPTVTNALLCAQNVCVVLAGDTNVFTVAAIDPDNDALSYRWSFGDGSVSDWLTAGDIEHVYSNCIPSGLGLLSVNRRISHESLLPNNILQLRGDFLSAERSARLCDLRGDVHQAGHHQVNRRDGVSPPPTSGTRQS